ncbi:MAG: type I-U CRISPR-associated protein Cas7 [Blastopirellula sp.]|nr:MAG: type I-U CRISPR-associated protein Cas7 [Blastopirellula sp.]
MSLFKSDHFDDLLTGPNIAAIVMRQPLKPVEGSDAIIYPPTFADVGYNIDTLGDEKEGKNVCVIDSVGSQANRMEPLFKQKPYSDLVPKIQIRVKTKETEQMVHLFDAGHRIADAVVRCSELLGDIKEAFLNVKSGNYESLARLAPTSLVFGVWDSRGTYVKLPRVVRSTIRALNVRELTRSATFFPAINYGDIGIGGGDGDRKASTEGLAGALDSKAPGGVLLCDDSLVIREAVLSLSALRAIRAESDDATLTIRRYILGLSLVMFTAPQEALLRMGCELTADLNNPATWEQVACSGERESFELNHNDALEFAKATTKDFGIAKDRVVDFDAKKAGDSLKKKKK